MLKNFSISDISVKVKKIASRRAPGKEHEARLLPEEQPAVRNPSRSAKLSSFAGRERRLNCLGEYPRTGPDYLL